MKTIEIKRLITVLEELDLDENALLVVEQNFKFNNCGIIKGNQKGLLKLAKEILTAAIKKPNRHTIDLVVPDSEAENSTFPFGIGFIERDDNLEYKERIYDGEKFTSVDRDKPRLKQLLEKFGCLVLFLLFATSLTVGFGTIIKWLIYLF